MRRLLDYDRASGVKTWHSYNPDTDQTLIETVQDVQPYLDRNRALQGNTGYSKQGIKNDMWHVGCIPIGVQMKWMTDYGVDVYKKEHKARVLKLLNDPEWKYLRTTTGRIGVPEVVKR